MALLQVVISQENHINLSSFSLFLFHQIVVPPLPGKALGKQLPFLKKGDGIFEEDFIEERRKSLEEFINK